MHSSFILYAVAAMTGSAMAQVRDMLLYPGGDTNCQGSALLCQAFDRTECCIDTEFALRFGSAVISNSQPNDRIAGFVPGVNEFQCGNLAGNVGQGSQCITDSAGGYTGLAWDIAGGVLGRRTQSGSAEKRRKLIFHDGPVFDLDKMSKEERKEVIDLAWSGSSSAAVPQKLWEFETEI